jgi:hypothetical protein
MPTADLGLDELLVPDRNPFDFYRLLDSASYFVGERIPTQHISKLFVEASHCKEFAEVVELATERFSTVDRLSRANRAAQIACQQGQNLNQSKIQQIGEQFATDPIQTLQDAIHLVKNKTLSAQGLDKFSSSILPEDRVMLYKIAGEGVPTIPDPEFIPSVHAAQPRDILIQWFSPITVLLEIARARGEIILLSLANFLKGARFLHQSGITSHLSELHLVAKQDDELGRLANDYKQFSVWRHHDNQSTMLKPTPVNNPDLKQFLPEYYGKLIHPTIVLFIFSYLTVKSCFPNEPIFGRKEDISRCYHRIHWLPSLMTSLAILITNTLVAIPITCGFGHMCTPYAYANITRLLQNIHIRFITAKEIIIPGTTAILTKLGDIYVDDSIYFGPSWLLFEIAEVTAHASTELMGSDALKVSKTIQSQVLDVIGARFNLITDEISPTWRSYLKLVYTFWVLLPLDVQVGTVIKLQLLQAMSSLATRYSVFMPILIPTAASFYALLRGNTKSTKVKLKIRQIYAIYLWRWVLSRAFDKPGLITALMTNVLYTSKEFRHLAQSHADVVVWSDAALEPTLLGIYVPDIGWCQVVWSGAPLSIASFEMLAVVLAFLFVIQLSHNPKHCHMRIDNKNSISWTRGHIKTNANFANALVIANAYIQFNHPNVLQTQEYIASKENIIADNISRNVLSSSQLNDPKCPRYQLNQPWQDTFNNWSQTSALTASQIVANLHTLRDEIVFLPFSQYIMQR